MYHIDDTISAMREVQRLLNVSQTGVYDEKTQKSVEIIRKKYNIENRNTIDYDTFNAIVKEYQINRINGLNLQYLFNPAFPYTIGDMGDNVGLINDAIRLVLSDFVYEGVVPKGKYLNQNTITAANFLRKIFKMDLSDEIDVLFVNRLLLEKSAIEIKRKFG